MGLAIDPANPWRSSAFAGIPVKRIAVPKPDRGVVQDNHEPEGAVTHTTVKRWLDTVWDCKLSDVDALNGMVAGTLVVDVEVGSKVPKSVDNAKGIYRTMPYNYSGGKGTQMHMTHAGRHIIVRPQVDGTVVNAMQMAPSVDKWVQAAGIKLPRVTAQQSMSSAIAGMPGATGGVHAVTSSEFESLRRVAANHALGDDYGDRLFNLARVVCHSRVCATMRRPHVVTPAMGNSRAYSILTADTPSLSVAQLQEHVYLYVHTDDTPEYRAFLTMGVRGVHNYTGAMESIYSACKVEVEAKQADSIVFIRVGGTAPARVEPDAGAYLRVLDNPDLCLAYYYAYARSMGLGESATAVLVQAAHAPHIWLGDAITPYKNCRPKLDACRYAVLPDEETAYAGVKSSKRLVETAAVVAEAYKAGLGCLVMGFSPSKDTDEAMVVHEWVERLADPETRRTIARAVSNRLCHGAVGLEWFTPFSYDVRAGYQACVEAWRECGYLLGMYSSCPVSSVAPCFTTGVDMTNAMIGAHMAHRPNKYAQTVVCAMVARTQLPGMCEPMDRTVAVQLSQVVPGLREWAPVITVVGFSGTKPHTSKLEDSPGRHAPEDLIPASSLSGIFSSPDRDDSTGGRSADAAESPSMPHRSPPQQSDTGSIARSESKVPSMASARIAAAGSSAHKQKHASSKGSTAKPAPQKSGASARMLPLAVSSVSREPPDETDSDEEEEEVRPPPALKMSRPLVTIEPQRPGSSSSSGGLRRLSLVDAASTLSERTRQPTVIEEPSTVIDRRSTGTAATASTKVLRLKDAQI